MHLKRIDIQGFKSFGDKSCIEFSPGITAIVGPNGSGKSNVADAVRWVLGEQSARALRGTKMEDVIFSGTHARRPLSFCEVVLTFDNVDGTLPVAYTEVAVSRRLYRSGESEYAINRSPCRMRDIVSIFYDTGIGREGYSIIGQGKIEEILSPKGEERRAAFEEAAGVTKYKVRKQEAQRKLDNVDNSMVRVADIMAELENSLEPLAEQAAEAREFLDLQNRLKDLDITLFADQYQRGSQRMEKLQKDIAALEESEREAKEREQALREEEELHTEKIRLMDGLLESAREKRFRLAQQISAAEGEMALSAQKEASFQENLQRIQEEITRDEALKQDVCQTMEVLAGERMADVDRLKRELDVLIAQRNDTRKALDESETSLDEAKQAHLKALAKESERNSMLARQSAILEQAGQRLAQLQETIARNRREAEQLKAEESAASKEGEAALAERTALELEIERIDEQYRLITERMRMTGAEIASEREKARAADHRAAIQRELRRNYEGYGQTVRLLMQDVRERGIPVDHGVYGPVGDLIKTGAAYEKAIGQALSASAQNIVIQEEGIGKALIQHLRNMDYGRGTFLPLSALKPRVFGAELERYRGMDGVIAPAMELVSYDQEIKAAVEYLLGRTLVVKDMDAAIAVGRASGQSFRCVTLEGDILSPGGTMTGGSNRDRGFLSRDRLIREAEAERDAAQKKLKALEEKRTEIEKAEAAASIKRDQMQKQLQQSYILYAQIQEKQEAIRYQLEHAEEEAGRWNLEEQRILVLMEEMKPQSTEEFGMDAAELEEQAEVLTQKVAQMRRRLEAEEAEVVAKQVNLSAVQSERASAEKEFARLERENHRLERTISENRAALAQLKGELDAVRTARTEQASGFSRAKQEMAENDTALNRISREKQELEVQLRAAIGRREELSGAMEENRDRRYRMGTQWERLAAEMEALENRMWSDYQVTYPMAEQARLDIRPAQAAQEAGTIRERIAEMGAVNPGAIEEYNRIRDRYHYLEEQNADLLKAKDDLNRLITELMQEMQQRFVSQFRIINENFQQTFSALFKGGEARLELSDEANALDCSIEIIAQPPGKRLQNISLLSGGERALTAIAILFAMLDLKATPFCILDEIETALDDENLRLFADYLGNYSEDTQFIAITHRRPTMEAADALYGVTMEERGVSKLVSVRFEDI